MGLVGLFVGPVLMALLVAIWREWLLTAQSDTAPDAKLEAAVALDEPAQAEGVMAPAVIASAKAPAWSASQTREIAAP